MTGKIITRDSSLPDVLPDCRSSERRGAFIQHGMWWIPVYCGNCGKPGPAVPEEFTTFAFWLCRNCEKFGEIAGTMMVPDEIFWEAVKQEQIETYGRELSPGELADVVAARTTPLAALILEGR